MATRVTATGLSTIVLDEANPVPKARVTATGLSTIVLDEANPVPKARVTAIGLCIIAMEALPRSIARSYLLD